MQGWRFNDKLRKNVNVTGSLREQYQQRCEAGTIEGLITSLNVLPCNTNISVRKDVNAAPSIKGEITAYTEEAETVIAFFVDELTRLLTRYANEYPGASLVMTHEQLISPRARQLAH